MMRMKMTTFWKLLVEHVFFLSLLFGSTPHPNMPAPNKDLRGSPDPKTVIFLVVTVILGVR